MKFGKALISCALAALAAACTVEPAPLATLRVPSPVVVSPAPVVVAPAFHRPHRGRGWGHFKHGPH